MRGLILLCLCLAVAGCGYTTRSAVAGKYRTVYVVPFANKVDITSENAVNSYNLYRPRLETDITRAIMEKFLRDGNLRPVRSKDDADLVLEGAVISLRKDPLRYTSSDDVQEYRINISVNMRMLDARTGTVLWEEPSFAGDATYFVTGALAKSESAALTDAINDLSRRVIERAVDQW